MRSLLFPLLKLVSHGRKSVFHHGGRSGLAGAFLIAVVVVGCPGTASATYSIVACDRTGSCGAAVATNNLAVGASVISAQAGVGAVASQFETNPFYGPRALTRLQAGMDAEAVVRWLLETDGDFDGQDTRYRQVAVVGLQGDGFAYTGSEAQASPWAGALAGPGFSIQGNGLRSEAVVEAMRRAFLAHEGGLPHRLLAAVEAGQAAGGQTTGALSAALLVRTPEGGWQDTDLRVDASATPVEDLRRLLGMHQATAALARAERAARRHDHAAARTAMAEAAKAAPAWDRVWRRIARLSVTMQDLDQARLAFATFAGLNPSWAATERDDAFYQGL